MEYSMYNTVNLYSRDTLYINCTWNARLAVATQTWASLPTDFPQLLCCWGYRFISPATLILPQVNILNPKPSCLYVSVVKYNHTKLAVCLLVIRYDHSSSLAFICLLVQFRHRMWGPRWYPTVQLQYQCIWSP